MNRERVLEQALKHELRGDAVLTPDCIDAETMAAWQDNALDAAQMSAVEAHLSTCPRCQAMLGAFARGSVTIEAEAPADRGFQLWKWWLAPIAAGAAAVMIWMVVPEQQEIATSPAQPPAAVAVDALRERPAAPAADQAAPSSEARAAKRDANAANRVEGEAKLKAETARDDRQQQLKDNAAPKEQAFSQPATPAAAPPAAAREERAAAPAIAQLQKSARISIGLELMSPDPSRRWRVAASGIERSEDSGTTWRLVRQSAGESITSGTAPTPTICWMVGQEGVVLVTTDATTFTRVDLPERVDVTTIMASDALVAIVTTADRRRFRTDDGGRTWRLF